MRNKKCTIKMSIQNNIRKLNKKLKITEEIDKKCSHQTDSFRSNILA